MGNQGTRQNYLAAFEQANYHLDHIYSEYHELQQRKEKLEGVLMALEPFLHGERPETAEIRPIEFRSEPEPQRSEVYASQVFSEPIMRTESIVETPAPSNAYAPSEENLDPLQLRINRALGLAVA